MLPVHVCARYALTVSINHEGAEFPFRQLAIILRGRIRSGEYAPGRKIPSLIALQEEFGLSSMTVRRAVRLLAEEGLLRTVPGRGTFVMPATPPA